MGDLDLMNPPPDDPAGGSWGEANVACWSGGRLEYASEGFDLGWDGELPPLGEEWSWFDRRGLVGEVMMDEELLREVALAAGDTYREECEKEYVWLQDFLAHEERWKAVVLTVYEKLAERGKIAGDSLDEEVGGEDDA